jgi:CRISPR/Cas system CSM-associated protein Csm2 small subunit
MAQGQGRTKTFDITKISVAQIQDMVTTMDCKSLPDDVVQYIQLMEKARDWHYQMKSRLYVTRHLQAEYYVETHEELSDYLARRIFDDAINYYYADNRIRKDSWRNLLAEKYMIAAQLCFERHQMGEYRKFLESFERVKKLNDTEDTGIDPKLLDRRPHVYVVTTEELGVPAVNRMALRKMIDGYDIRENEKAKIKREAGILPRRLLDIQDAEIVDN